MTETARADDTTPIGQDAVPGIGAVLSAVTLAAMGVPIRRGLEEPVLWGGAAFAVLAVLAFLAGRHAGVERRIAAGIALVSSVAVVLLSGYALNQGIAASTVVPGLGWSVSLVVLAFLTAGLAAGIGAADYYGVGLRGLVDRSLRTAMFSIVGFAGLFAAQIATVILAQPILATRAPLSETEAVVVSQIGMAIGMGGFAIAYLVIADYDLSYIDLRLPSKREGLWAVGGLIVLFGALMAITMLFQSTGVESAEHGTTERAQESPEILLILIPAALLIIGPFEELLYRNVIQKSLYGTFSRYGAVVVASVIFALVHTAAYWTAGPGQVVASLGTIFGLSIVLGTVYEQTENVLIPALIHGAYNAILFTNLYMTYG